MYKGISAFAVFVMIFNESSLADEVIEQIEVGKKNYVEGDYAAAVTELEFALSALRNKLSSLFMATMPEPPAFWVAESPALEGGTALFGGGIMITREYREQKGDGKVKAELVVDSPMVQAFSAVLSNPIMIANEPRTERIRMGEASALLNWDPDEHTGEISLSIGGRVLAKVEGDDLSDKDVLIDLMKTWDLEAVKDVAGL